MAKISVNWTGSYPNLCSGEWLIHVDDKQLKGLGNSHMNTSGNYDTWSFDGGWSEEWDTYHDGQGFNQWVNNMPNNLEMSMRIAGFNVKNIELLRELYIAISEKDWRSNSCGGCI